MTQRDDQRLGAGVRRDRTERGATATEYGALLSFAVIAVIVGVGTFGGALDDVYDGFATWVTTTLY